MVKFVAKVHVEPSMEGPDSEGPADAATEMAAKPKKKGPPMKKPDQYTLPKSSGRKPPGKKMGGCVSA